MEKALISIIVPIYNADKYLERCIESILGQTYDNIQLILVNDGSTDDSHEIIERYALVDNRIILVNKENTGVSDSRNKGIDIATGEFIGFVDADDYIEPNMYESLLQEMTDTDADICCCGYRQEFEDYRYDIAISERQVFNSTEEIIAQYLRQDIRNGIFDGNWNKLFRRQCIENIRYKDIKHGEDILFQFRVFLNSCRMVCVPDLLYHYVDNENSASNREFNQNKLSIVDVAREIKDTTIADFSDLSEQAYSFELTWYLALAQDMIRSGVNSKCRTYIKIIQRELRARFDCYYRNRYSKRLDQYYLVALSIGIEMMRMSYGLRTLVRKIKPSKDRIERR